MSYRVVPSTVRRGRNISDQWEVVPNSRKGFPNQQRSLGPKGSHHSYLDGLAKDLPMGGMDVVPSNIIPPPEFIGQELNSNPALDEARTEFNSEKGNVIGLGRAYHRPGRGRDRIQFPDWKYNRP